MKLDSNKMRVSVETLWSNDGKRMVSEYYLIRNIEKIYTSCCDENDFKMRDYTHNLDDPRGIWPTAGVSKNPQEGKLMTVANKTFCSRCFISTQRVLRNTDNAERILVPNAAHPLYLRWAYKMTGADWSNDSVSKIQATQQEVFGAVAENHQMAMFVQCTCQMCKNEWIVVDGLTEFP